MNRVYILMIGGVSFVLAASLHAAERDRLTARSMAYVLQADELAHPRERAVRLLASCGRDLIVLDCSYDAERGGEWTEREIEQIRCWPDTRGHTSSTTSSWK